MFSTVGVPLFYGLSVERYDGRSVTPSVWWQSSWLEAALPVERYDGRSNTCCLTPHTEHLPAASNLAVNPWDAADHEPCHTDGGADTTISLPILGTCTIW